MYGSTPHANDSNAESVPWSADEVVVAGPCGSGKSTLVETLHAAGFSARAVAQEHSVIHDLWMHRGKPLALVVLEASPPVITERRGTDFPAWLHEEQMERLTSAREHADIIVDTDTRSAEDVSSVVIDFLHDMGLPGE